MTFIKICGITSPEDAAAACEAGADAIGVIFAESKRQVTVDAARTIRPVVPSSIALVGVFLDQPLPHIQRMTGDVGLDWVQLHGQENPDWAEALDVPVIKRHDLPEGGRPVLLEAMARHSAAAWHLLDPGAGSGRTFDWQLAHGLPGQVMVSGGLGPDNVAEAIRIAQPRGVDVASGVEVEPGRKDHRALIQFVEQVRAADAHANSR